ncbi:MAG: hypothetical protein IAG13_03035, partial [Deltaproteobacteria bacterium]|nr:hypothetical protein [Nannocystaceae bacterium]
MVMAVDGSSSNARKHESRNPIQRALIRRFTAALCDQVARLRPRSVLDVGCGEGYMLHALAAATPQRARRRLRRGLHA